MADAPLIVILEMIQLVIGNTMSTLSGIFGLFLELMGSLNPVSNIGIEGTILAGVLILIILFFMAKFFFSSWKQIFMLMLALVIVVALIIIGSV
ncbi:MAG: hypothetical protein ABIJ92_04555 [Candidatus Aenigmatarchaeota archaeon]